MVDVNAYLAKCDQTQTALLDEECILVNEKDEVTGSASKKDCHLLTNIDKGMLHRAFSIFLFDNSNRLLLQKRSNFKITYPDLWTNTCCSHPLNIPGETDGVDGVKKAARRRLLYEFGIDVQDLEKFNYLTRIQYSAVNIPNDGIFGENEIDYILFVKGDYVPKPSENEISEHKYFTMDELKKLTSDDADFKVTPWFKLISKSHLFNWWAKLDNIKEIQDFEKIHKF